MDLNFVDRNGRQDVKEIVKTVKNKFNWSCLDVNRDFFSDYVWKVSEPGIAWCISCKKRTVIAVL